uniref:myelin-associated glycoprotein-like isoform X4 n=1 Tax=Pristiophorus japonicus TaxID=55135 RepID=UPI00398F7D89
MTAPVIAVFSIAVVLEGMLQADSNQTVPITRRLRGQKGLCVLIPCNYSEPETPLPTGLVAVWYKDYDRPTNSTVYHPNQDLIDRDYKARARLSGNLSEGDCSLIIGGLQGGDNGAYRFTIEHTALNFTGGDLQIELEITDLEWKPNITYSSEIVADRSTTLDCSFVDDCRGQGPNLTWINSTLLMSSPSIKRSRGDNSTSLFSTSLTFVPSYKDNGKEVGCKAQFVLADSWSVQTLVLDVKHAPRNLTISLPDGTPVNVSLATEEGLAFSLLCVADSDPPSNLTWLVDGRVRNSSAGSEELWLVVTNVTYQDDGEHRCLAVNSHGTLQVSVTVDLKYSPRETVVRFSGDAIKEGDEVTLTCGSKSNPPATNYSWFRADGSQRFVLVANSDSIGLGRVTRDNQTSFFCTAENTIGSSNSSLFHLSVEYKPEISPESDCARRTEGVTCVCTAIANPPGDLTWHQPFSNVSGNQTGSRFVAWQVTHGQLVTGSLTLMTGEAEEETRVACSVRNQHGEAWFNVYLWVKGRTHYLSEIIVPAIGGAAVMLILSLIFCLIIVRCRRRAKPSPIELAEMEILTGQLTPVLTQEDEQEAEERGEGGEEEELAELGTEELSETESVKRLENGETGQVSEEELELHYACIDFSKARPSNEIVGVCDSTQYAEIKPQ